MKLPAKSAKINFDIKDFYAVKVGVLWKAFKAERPAFWWLCVYFFLEYVRPASLYPVLDVLPWVQIAIFFTLIGAFTDKGIKWVKNPVNVQFLMFYILVLLSSVFAFNLATSFELIDVVINWIIVYFMIICVVNTEKRFFLFLLLFLLVNFKMSQHGFMSFASRGFSYTVWGVVGPPGWFGDSGDFGIAMLFFVALSTAFAIALRDYWGKIYRLFFYFLPVSGLVTIIGTSSRGVQLGLVAMVFWLLLKSRRGIKVALGVLVIGSALYAILPDEMLDEFRNAGEDNTSTDRLKHWDFGYEVALDHPILGVGYNNWLNYCNFSNPNGLGHNDRCRLPHNTYISAASEIGILGLLLYTSMLVYILVLNARTRANVSHEEDRFIYYISHGLDAGIIGYSIASIFFTVLFYPMFWIQLAMTVALFEISKKKVVVPTGKANRVNYN